MSAATKLYTGVPPGAVSVRPAPGAIPAPLAPRFDLRNHSPDGFAWGYAGSGPSQLALALLADATGDDKLAVKLYQDYKADVVGRLPKNSPFAIQQAEVLAWVAEQGQEPMPA